MNNTNNLSENRAMNRVVDNLEDGFSYNPQALCPAGGIHDFEKQWLFTDYLLSCYCCPYYLLKDCCCGWFYRNPMDDSFDGVGCKPTGPGICSKCRQSEQQTKDAFALRQFQAHTGAGVHSPRPPRVPAPVQYVSTNQMLHPPQMRTPQNQINPSTVLHSSPPTIVSPPPPYPTRTPPPPSYDEQIIQQNEQNNNGEQFQHGRSHDFYNPRQNHVVYFNEENMSRSHARDPSGDEQNGTAQNHIKNPGQGINYN